MPKRRRQGTSSDVIIMASKSIWCTGELVWAKHNYEWWPGIVLGESNVIKKHTQVYVIFWTGENAMSNVNATSLIYFFGNCKDMILNIENRSPKWKKAVCAVIKVLYNKDCSWEEILQFAKTGFPNCENLYSIKIPEWMKKIISYGEGKKLLSISALREITTKKKFSLNTKKMIDLKIKKKEAPDNFCLACYQTYDLVADHPFFEAKLCKDCAENMKNNIFLKGDDGIYYCCSICSLPNYVIICDNFICHRVYCKICIEDLAAPKAWETFINTNNWYCFLCNTKKRNLNGLLRPREDYLQKILEMVKFDGPQLVTYPNIPKGTKLRVLSLFDGIATGYVALRSLKINIDTYYASEIDQDSIKISNYNFPSKIVHLGDITLITKDVIRKISPIHLVIGGSPCNDLSLVNPTRKGLHDVNGTGRLFFEFYRIINLLKIYNSGFYWLYENVASMPSSYKNEISMFLQCHPVLHDAVVLSPQHRPRLFWGNISTLEMTLIPDDVVLQDVLAPNRTAQVIKMNTVTTRNNSLLQGVNEDYPVIDEDAKPDVPWITELEKIFGLPEHYTDVGCFSVSQRQKVLGKAWSVPVIIQLLKFLKLNKNISHL